MMTYTEATKLYFQEARVYEQNLVARLGTYVYHELEECFDTPEYDAIIIGLLEQGVIECIETTTQIGHGQTRLVKAYRLTR